jgi:hypothetical protein
VPDSTGSAGGDDLSTQQGLRLQVLAANGIFAWYGIAAGWAVPSSAVTAWMGTTVIEVVAVVLVIVNYLFPGERRKYA